MRHVPSLAGAVEAFRQSLAPLVEAEGDTGPVTDLQPVTAVVGTRWDGGAPVRWKTRRVHPGIATWCGERWPLAEDPLAGVPPRRLRADNTRAIPLGDLEEL